MSDYVGSRIEAGCTDGWVELSRTDTGVYILSMKADPSKNPENRWIHPFNRAIHKAFEAVHDIGALDDGPDAGARAFGPCGLSAGVTGGWSDEEELRSHVGTGTESPFGPT